MWILDRRKHPGKGIFGTSEHTGFVLDDSMPVWRIVELFTWHGIGDRRHFQQLFDSVVTTYGQVFSSATFLCLLHDRYNVPSYSLLEDLVPHAVADPKSHRAVAAAVRRSVTHALLAWVERFPEDFHCAHEHAPPSSWAASEDAGDAHGGSALSQSSASVASGLKTAGAVADADAVAVDENNGKAQLHCGDQDRAQAGPLREARARTPPQLPLPSPVQGPIQKQENAGAGSTPAPRGPESGPDPPATRPLPALGLRLPLRRWLALSPVGGHNAPHGWRVDHPVCVRGGLEVLVRASLRRQHAAAAVALCLRLELAEHAATARPGGSTARSNRGGSHGNGERAGDANEAAGASRGPVRALGSAIAAVRARALSRFWGDRAAGEAAEATSAGASTAPPAAGATTLRRRGRPRCAVRRAPPAYGCQQARLVVRGPLLAGGGTEHTDADARRERSVGSGKMATGRAAGAAAGASGSPVAALAAAIAQRRLCAQSPREEVRAHVARAQALAEAVRPIEEDIARWWQQPGGAVADWLTKRDWALFAGIKPRELVGLAWQGSGRELRAPTVCALTSRFNRMSRCVTSCILAVSDPVARAAEIGRWVSLASALRARANAFGVGYVAAGLGHPQIARLVDTADRLSEDTRDARDRALALASDRGGYSQYRAFVQRCGRPLRAAGGRGQRLGAMPVPGGSGGRDRGGGGGGGNGGGGGGGRQFAGSHRPTSVAFSARAASAQFGVRGGAPADGRRYLSAGVVGPVRGEGSGPGDCREGVGRLGESSFRRASLGPAAVSTIPEVDSGSGADAIADTTGVPSPRNPVPGPNRRRSDSGTPDESPTRRGRRGLAASLPPRAWTTGGPRQNRESDEAEGGAGGNADRSEGDRVGFHDPGRGVAGHAGAEALPARAVPQPPDSETPPAAAPCPPSPPPGQRDPVPPRSSTPPAAAPQHRPTAPARPVPGAPPIGSGRARIGVDGRPEPELGQPARAYVPLLPAELLALANPHIAEEARRSVVGTSTNGGRSAAAAAAVAAAMAAHGEVCYGDSAAVDDAPDATNTSVAATTLPDAELDLTPAAEEAARPSDAARWATSFLQVCSFLRVQRTPPPTASGAGIRDALYALPLFGDTELRALSLTREPTEDEVDVLRLNALDELFMF